MFLFNNIINYLFYANNIFWSKNKIKNQVKNHINYIISDLKK